MSIIYIHQTQADNTVTPSMPSQIVVNVRREYELRVKNVLI